MTLEADQIGQTKIPLQFLQRYFCFGYASSFRSVIVLSLRINLLLRFDSNSRFSVIDPSVNRNRMHKSFPAFAGASKSIFPMIIKNSSDLRQFKH